MEFVSKFSLHKFKILLFGLYNTPSTFKHLVNHVFSNIMDWYVLVYFDDILVSSKTTDNHEKHLYVVFSQLYIYKLQEKHAKYEFEHA